MKRFIVALILLAGTVSPTVAQALLEGKETLSGLTGVYVVAKPMNSKIGSDRINASRIEAAAKNALREYGVKILSKTEYMSDHRGPCYCIEYVQYVGEDGFSAFHINFLLQQKVQIVGMRSYTFATTWDTNGFAAGPSWNNPTLEETSTIHASALARAFIAANQSPLGED
jgi:hypothetical protein